MIKMKKQDETIIEINTEENSKELDYIVTTNEEEEIIEKDKSSNNMSKIKEKAKILIQKDKRLGIAFLAFALLLLAMIFSAVIGAMAGGRDSISQGVVSAKDVSINTKIPGRIVKFYVEEGQQVKAGDPIVEISSEELIAKKAQVQAQVEQAKAGVEASKAVVKMAEANYNASQARVGQAAAGVDASGSQKDMASAVNDKAQKGARTQEVAQAESAYNLWKSTYDRALVLYNGGAMSKQKLEEIKTQMEVSKQTFSMAQEGARTEDKAAALAQLQMANAGVNASTAVLNQAQEGANAALAQLSQAQAGLVAAEGKLAQAEAGLKEIEVYLQDTRIKAPIDGYVTALNSDEGELVSTGTSIGTISNMDKCWITVNLDETKLAMVTEGQKVSVKLAAFKNTSFTGTITSISKQPDFAVKKATNENGNMDIVSYGVKIELDNSDKKLRPGMSATVDFEKKVK